MDSVRKWFDSVLFDISLILKGERNMKITSIDALQLPSGGAAASSRGAWSPVLVRINTDEGICGWGEAGLAYGKGWRAGLGMIQDFAEQIIGMNPMHIEEIWETIFRKTFWGMGGGTVVSAAMSAIDIALLDLKGKALGVPVYELLGGKTNDNLRVYASQIQFNWGSDIKNRNWKRQRNMQKLLENVFLKDMTVLKLILS